MQGCITAISLRALLREGSSDTELSSAIARMWRQRADRYSETRTVNTAGLSSRLESARKIEMSYIGG